MSGIEHRHLRSALEFAVLIAAEGQKRRPPLSFPKELRPFLNKPRLPSGALGTVRRAIEADDAFRSVLAVGALPELVDEIGRLWLERPAGWERAAAAEIEALDAAAGEADLSAALKRAEKRRDAAEQAAARTRAELVAHDREADGLRDEITELQADVVKLADEAAELRTELIDTRNEVRHARDRERAAVDRLEAAERELAAARDDRNTATRTRDEVLASRADAVASVSEIASALADAHALANRLESLLPSQDPVSPDRPRERKPLALPGGIISTSAEAAEYFARSEAAVLVDGYNVAKLAWPSRTLEQQRQTLLDAVENLVRRFGTDLTVVFDGASIVGAHATRRRLIRVVYSPEGVIADDVIRDEVRRLPTSRAVVVVTDDREIVRDVRADGANTLPSAAFFALL